MKTMKLEITFILVFALLTAGCCQTFAPNKLVDIPALDNKSGILPNPVIKNTTKEAVEPIVVPRNIPSNSLILFSTESLGSATEYLRTGSGRVSWDSDSYGIVGYIPSLEEKHVVYTFSSLSYSKSFAYPITKGNRLFIIREWGDSGDRDIETVRETDPLTGDVISETRLSPSASSVAIVDNQIYFKTPVVSDFYGRRTGGGKLYVQTIGSSNSQQLDALDGPELGKIYGVGSRLLSVARGDMIEIRSHASTGAVERTLYSIQDTFVTPPEIYEGETALYLAGKASESPDVYQIYRLGLDGKDEGIMEITLSADEDNILIDEEKGKVLVSILKDFKISSVVVYDLATKTSEEITLNKPVSLKAGHNGNQYLYVD